MATIRQTSFSAGELSPRMWGRTDLELYAHGARRLRNFLVNQQGEAVTRPGTKREWLTKLNGDVLLVPFLMPAGQSGLVLELGVRYCRVYDSRLLTLLGEVVSPCMPHRLPARLPR